MKKPTQRPATVHIQRMDIRLPAGLKHRANGIARRAVAALSQLNVGQSAQLERLDLPVLKINGGETDAIIARQIAIAIHAQLEREGGGR